MKLLKAPDAVVVGVDDEDDIADDDISGSAAADTLGATLAAVDATNGAVDAVGVVGLSRLRLGMLLLCVVLCEVE